MSEYGSNVNLEAINMELSGHAATVVTPAGAETNPLDTTLARRLVMAFVGYYRGGGCEQAPDNNCDAQLQIRTHNRPRVKVDGYNVVCRPDCPKRLPRRLPCAIIEQLADPGAGVLEDS